MPNIFLEWNMLDPVSQHELNRNDILQTIQGNRNPFIDNPFLATLIWNGPQAEDSWNILSVDNSASDAVTIYPTITYDYINISNQQNQEVEYSVYNYVGQFIQSGTTSDKINLSECVPGMYIIKLHTQGGVKTYKVFRK